MINFLSVGQVCVHITLVLEVTFLSIPEVCADEIWECSSLYVQNLLHL